MNGDGSARLVPDVAGARDVYIPPEELAGVAEGERVSVDLEVGRKGRVRGRITVRHDKAPQSVVGVIRRQAHATYLVAEDGSLAFVIPPKELGAARDGDAVTARVLKQSSSGASLAAVVEVLGRPDDPRVQVEMAVRATNWPRVFSEETLREVGELADIDAARALADGRVDLRGVPHVTIDGEDARDFDDAVSARPERDGYRVWVSIADVSHYVRPGTALDDEARGRATSVYFPDRVLPMLPERLSNELCSLRPRVPRLTLTCEMHVRRDGRLEDVRVYASLIESAARLTYTEVQKVIEQREQPEFVFNQRPAPPHPHADLINELTAVARWLRAARQKRGALDFDLPEAKVVLDERGVAKDIQERQRLEAHRVIEDLMIAANEAVAEHLLERQWPGSYRVHEPPDPLKLELVARWADKLGIPFDAERARHPTEVQKLLDRLRKHPSGGVVQGLVLRMLSQARYAAQNLGHYGLASTAYLHFTSPIRRYPDLLVHRSLRALWARERPPSGFDALSEHCSRQERKAVDAERAVVGLMQCQIAQQHIGKVMHATITGVHNAGAFVRPRELFVDGLIAMEALSSRFRAFYRYDEENQMLVAPRSGHMLKLGDRLKVQLASVNMRRRFIDFVPENVEQTMSELRGVRQKERRRGREELRETVRDERGRSERGRNTRRSAGGKPGGGRSGRGKPPRGRR